VSSFFQGRFVLLSFGEPADHSPSRAKNAPEYEGEKSTLFRRRQASRMSEVNRMQKIRFRMIAGWSIADTSGTDPQPSVSTA
jgi:hypothetical protein